MGAGEGSFALNLRFMESLLTCSFTVAIRSTATEVLPAQRGLLSFEPIFSIPFFNAANARYGRSLLPSGRSPRAKSTSSCVISSAASVD